MRSLFLFVFLILTSLVVWSGDIKLVSITYDYVSDNPNESPNQAKNNAFQYAKAKALEDNFGTDVTSMSNMIQRNISRGDTMTSTNDLFALRETAIRGEWIETIEEKLITLSYLNNLWHVQVYIKGRARNRTTKRVDIKFNFTSKEQRNSKPTTCFDNGDNIFMQFSSPADGTLCVYLVDENKDVYCLLPYASNNTGFQEIKANTDYLFFSRKENVNADAYALHTTKIQEQNAIYIIFSPNKFTKANDNKISTSWREEPKPRQLAYQDFLQWLSHNQMLDENLIVHTEIISIVK